MAYDSKPSTWLGAGYTLASSEVKLTTDSHAGNSIGTFTVVAATDVITLTAHGLKVGDVVRVASGTTLPAGLSASTDYWVLTVPSVDTLTLSASRGGAVVDITDTGTGTHTMYGIAVPELTDAEANASTGDVRKVFYALCEMMWQAYNNTASADRPAKMRIFRSTSSNDAAGSETRSYTISFDVASTGTEVASE